MVAVHVPPGVGRDMSLSLRVDGETTNSVAPSSPLREFSESLPQLGPKKASICRKRHSTGAEHFRIVWAQDC